MDISEWPERAILEAQINLSNSFVSLKDYEQARVYSFSSND
jgi:hypothetical protein